MLWYSVTYRGADSPQTCSELVSKKPWVIDWSASQRQALHAQVAQGVVVVEVACDTVRVLEGCSADGGYGLITYLPREREVSLEGRSQLRANLPFSAWRVSDEAMRFTTLDVARYRTTRRGVEVDELVGGEACEGATHIISTVMLGAYALGAEDGTAACRDVQPGDALPEGCDVPLSVKLVALGLDTSQVSPESIAQLNYCPGGYAPAYDGVCVTEGSEATLCEFGDATGCAEACEAGHDDSCELIATMYVLGEGVEVDEAQAAQWSARGCELGSLSACRILGYLELNGLGVAQDVPGAIARLEDVCARGEASACRDVGSSFWISSGSGIDRDTAMTRFERSCQGGDPDGCSAIGVLAWQDGDEAAALEHLAASCRDHSELGCTYLGDIYAYGYGDMEVDLVKAEVLYEQACELGGAQACVSYALVLLDGAETPELIERGLSMLEEACEAGSAHGCKSLAVMYGSGLVVDYDRDRAFSYYQQACDIGDVDGCARVGAYLVNHGDSARLKLRGVDMLEQSCNAGAAQGCVELGELFEYGEVVEVNIEQAETLYAMACELAGGEGCGALGLLYLNNKSSGGSIEEGVALLQRSCEEGSPGGCANLGVLYIEGRHLALDVEGGVALLRSACDLGSPLGCANLGYVLLIGLAPVEKDVEEALVVLTYACDLGNGLGCANLGAAYASGVGVEVDLEKARELFEVACEEGQRARVSEPGAPRGHRGCDLWQRGRGPDALAGDVQRAERVGVCRPRHFDG